MDEIKRVKALKLVGGDIDIPDISPEVAAVIRDRLEAILRLILACEDYTLNEVSACLLETKPLHHRIRIHGWGYVAVNEEEAKNYLCTLERIIKCSCPQGDSANLSTHPTFLPDYSSP